MIRQLSKQIMSQISRFNAVKAPQVKAAQQSSVLSRSSTSASTATVTATATTMPSRPIVRKHDNSNGSWKALHQRPAGSCCEFTGF